MTCREFKALPPEMRSAEDASLLRLAQAQAWKNCKSCGVMVSRIDGCNHIHCRCGASFCYGCGEPYRDNKPTANNQHGTAGCRCPLFNYPADGDEDDEDDEGGGAAPILLQPWRPRPVRAGRRVSATPCRRARSIRDCPKKQYCWFSHEGDDEYAGDRYWGFWLVVVVLVALVLPVLAILGCIMSALCSNYAALQNVSAHPHSFRLPPLPTRNQLFGCPFYNLLGCLDSRLNKQGSKTHLLIKQLLSS